MTSAADIDVIEDELDGLSKEKSRDAQGESLQKILLPERTAIDSLYLRYLSGYSEILENSLCMKKGAKVSFNTFFNSFYESYWGNISCVADLSLELNFVGSITIEVFRDNKHYGCSRIGLTRLNADSPETRVLQLDGFSPTGQAGRLFVDITASKKSQVSGLCFKTNTSIRRHPKISIGICTFNCEQLLLRNLLAILDLPALNEGISKIIIVNQGPRFALAELAELVCRSKHILLVEQGDLGGCDGFTRTMHEASKQQGVTHHVLMDNDAVIDARLLESLLTLLSFINDDTIVCGYKLDLKRPHFLYEAGAQVKPNARIKSLHYSIDLRAVDSLIPLNKYHTVDYNASWFSAVPVEHIRADEFPVPILVRGGDIECDLRLQERGVKIVAMPGIAVWREPEDISKAMSPVFDLLLSGEADTIELYRRTIRGNVYFNDEPFGVNKSKLALQEGAKVSLNTYFSSFFEDYWNSITDCKNLYIQLEYSGSIILEVFRDSKNLGCRKIAEVENESDGIRKELIKIPVLNGIDATGRIFFDITARKSTYIKSIRLTTLTPAKRKPKVSIGICTFNRESFLLQNLLALLELEDLKDSLSKIIVVNQGASFSSPALAELVLKSDRVLLIKQGNLGGCGGFTRTMYESLQLEGISHHVLMDDDALVDARVLTNLFSLLAHVRDDYAIGGHMLDLLRPNVLYEAGAQVRPNTRIKSLHHNIDLRAVDSLIPFNKYHAVDYNAWWFCAIPVEHIRAAEFPAPIFIRGDDMEYGLRLQERGVKTVAMPGIAVWHEPFYVKVGGWQTYYDLRNRLILASTYPHRFKHESPLDVLWWMLKATASHDYLTAALLVKAVRDFLQGPSFLEKGADVVHAEVAALAKSLAQPSVAENDLPAPPAKLRSMPKSDWAHGLIVTGRLIQTLIFSKITGATLLLDHEANLSNIGHKTYVKTNGIGSYRLRFEPNRSRLIRALIDSFGAWFAYRRNRGGASDAWGQQVPQLRSPGTWEEIFQTDASRRKAAG